MARTPPITINNTWQQVSSDIAIITVVRTSSNSVTIKLNDSASDAEAVNYVAENGNQYAQNETKPVYMRTVQAGSEIEVIVDQVG